MQTLNLVSCRMSFGIFCWIRMFLWSGIEAIIEDFRTQFSQMFTLIIRSLSASCKALLLFLMKKIPVKALQKNSRGPKLIPRKK